MSQAAAAVGGARVITYIDGFNLYYGMREAGFHRYYWLDLKRLSMHLMGVGNKLTEVKYFTSRVSDPADKRARQTTYLEAVSSHCGIKPIEGQFLKNYVECFGCHRKWPDHEEKMTDVNIATELLTDAFQNRFDLAIVVSGDSDLAPPLHAVKRLFPTLRVKVAFPPLRESYHLRQAAHELVKVTEARLAASQMPDEVTRADGYVLKRPPSWASADPNAAP